MKFTFPPESTPLAGYTIKRGIHRGGFGEVYYAHTEAGKEVALKLLQSQLEVELRGVRQCLNLKHPNLVGLYDIRIDDDGDHWIVMEYVAGRNLADVLDGHPDGLPLDEVVRWIDGMAAGLDFLHDRGIVHRDLKPGNVFIEQGLVKVGDVGLSKYISQSRRNEQTQSVGTVYYMAPEVAHGRYGREVDVYSLGVVLYELLTGRVPFDGESTGEILMKHLSEPPNLDAVEPRFRRVIGEALEKDPARRIATAGELARRFSRAAVNRSSTRRPAYATAGATAATVPGTFVPPDRDTEYDPGSDESAATTHHAAPESPAPEPPRTETHCGPSGWQLLTSGRARSAFLDRHPALPWYTALVMFGLLVAPGFTVPVVLAVIAYYCGRRAFATSNRGDCGRTSPRTRPVAATQPSPSRTRARCVQRHKPSELLSPDTLRVIPFRQRVAEWSGAMAYAVPVAALVVLGVLLLSPLLPSMSRSFSKTSFVDPGMVGHFALVTVLASWAILTLSKFTEGRRTNGLHRRLAFFLAGSLVGAAAFWLHGVLFVELFDGFFRPRNAALVHHLPDRPLMTHDGQPTLHGYMLFFGLLFAVRSWWRHVDGLRTWRLQVWTIAVTGLVGFVLPSFFAFPHLWGVLWAAAISCVTQLAAPWMAPDERRQLLENRARV